MVPVRAGLATYNSGRQAESTPNPSKGERVCLVPYLLRGLGFPIHPFLRGLLEFCGLQLHNFTHRWLCRLLRAVSGLRSSFRATEEAVLPRTLYTRGVDISSGQSRGMAH